MGEANTESHSRLNEVAVVRYEEGITRRSFCVWEIPTY